jgi:formylglycine-generating enzyme required for sulfatase activity
MYAFAKFRLELEEAKPTGTGQEGSMKIAIFVLAVGAILGAALARTGAAVRQSGNSTVGLAASGTEFKPGQTLRDCSDCPQMIAIPAGSFLMGAPANELGRFQEEGPQRPVGIRQFAAGTFDVTRGEWAKFVADTKRQTIMGCAWAGGTTEGEPDPKASWRNLNFPQDDTHPVVCVTWNDTQDYVRWLSQKTGHKYRLLTEAEWEYAARAGTKTPFPWGAEATHENANYGADKCCSGLALGRDRWLSTSPVGSFPPNGFGLHDMNGNVLQFVQDCFMNSYSGAADGWFRLRDCGAAKDYR